MDDHAILSFRAAGGLLGDTLGQDELLAAVAGERADAVLLSAGGNDHLGSSQLTRVLGPFGLARDAEGYLGATFDTFLAGALASYRRLVEAVAASDPRVVVAGATATTPRSRRRGDGSAVRLVDALGFLPGDEANWVLNHGATMLGGSSGSCVADFAADGTKATGLHFAGRNRARNWAHALAVLRPVLEARGATFGG